MRLGGKKKKPQQGESVPMDYEKLFEQLIRPFEDLLLKLSGDHKVILIPHEDLFLVPFYCLRNKEGQSLAEMVPISILPSIQLLQINANKRAIEHKKEMKSHLIVGNPSLNFQMRSYNLPGKKCNGRYVN
jgi:CHAT domain-containing protein